MNFGRRSATFCLFFGSRVTDSGRYRGENGATCRVLQSGTHCLTDGKHPELKKFVKIVFVKLCPLCSVVQHVASQVLRSRGATAVRQAAGIAQPNGLVGATVSDD